MKNLKKITGIVCLTICITLLCIDPDQLVLPAIGLQFGLVLLSGYVSYRLLG